MKPHFEVNLYTFKKKIDSFPNPSGEGSQQPDFALPVKK